MATRKPAQLVEQMFRVLEKKPVIKLSTLQRELRTNYNTVKAYAELITKIQSKPKITVENTKVKLVEDRLDPFIRQIVGYTPDIESLLFMKLLAQGATGPEGAYPVAKLDKVEIELLNDLIQKEQMKLEGLGVYLTEMGQTVASGAQRLYGVAKE